MKKRLTENANEVKMRSFPDVPGFSFLNTGPSMTAWTVYHSSVAVCLTRAGAARYRYRGVEYSHRAGAVFFFEPGELHRDVRVESPSAYSIAFLNRELVDLKKKRLPCGPENDPALARDLIEFALTEGSGESLLKFESRLRSLIAAVHRRCDSIQSPVMRPARIGRARDYILDNLGRNISLSELAGVAGLSPDHLIVSFKATTGLPPHAFQIAARLARAQDLLLAGIPGAEIAADVGFSDQAHLIRHFRRAYGTTPSAMAADRVPLKL